MNAGMPYQDSDNEDEVELGIDMEGEKDLCGSFNEDEELDYNDHLNSEMEEGEVDSDSEESDGEDNEIQDCIKSGNVDKLKRILKRREEDCKKLEKQVQKEKQRE